MLLMTMFLNVNQSIRDIGGVLVDLVIISTGSLVVTTIRTRGQEYSSEAKRLRKSHELGPPHFHLFEFIVDSWWPKLIK